MTFNIGPHFPFVLFFTVNYNFLPFCEGTHYIAHIMVIILYQYCIAIKLLQLLT